MHFVFEKGIVKLEVVSQTQFVGFTDMAPTTQLGGNEKESSSFVAKCLWKSVWFART
jgi:hypothetical protein